MTLPNDNDGFFRHHPFLTWSGILVLSVSTIILLLYGVLWYVATVHNDPSAAYASELSDIAAERVEILGSIERNESEITFGDIEPDKITSGRSAIIFGDAPEAIPEKPEKVVVVAMKTESIDPEAMLRLAADMVSINPVSVEDAHDPTRYRVTVTVTAQE